MIQVPKSNVVTHFIGPARPSDKGDLNERAICCDARVRSWPKASVRCATAIRPESRVNRKCLAGRAEFMHVHEDGILQLSRKGLFYGQL